MLRDRWAFGRKTNVFTLQWHLTNACPYHCKHCYDRSVRDVLPLSDVMEVLEDFKQFCRRRRVQGRISFSGGDPFLYPHFWQLYEEVASNGIPVSILGNPIPGESIHRLIHVQPPLYYQVSLEGLKEHNDQVRGRGHYDQVMTFLSEARQAGLRTHVMLTLTRANLDQVTPLGEALRGLTERFTFNRLSRTGEAVSTEMPTKTEFVEFLKKYLVARKGNPVLGFKDNLFNVIRHHFHRPLFPGCSGFGCGAAFNFVALLPDGEVHACRKWPSLIGNVLRDTLTEIYESAPAARYRKGASACRSCRLHKVCGGCPAVSYGMGLDPLVDRDPYCFIFDRAELLAGF
jgi:selenobiotic family peptide radical SAM maturase